MKFSIITVSYNSENTIEETIQSVISQSYKDYEYILVDGGSTDNTLKIVNNYSKYFNKIISEKDNGIYNAINKGIKVSSGEIISILHSDNSFYSNSVLSDVKSVFENDKNSQCVIGNTLIFKETNNKKKIIRNYKANNFYKWMIYLGYSPPHPSSFFRKESYLKFGLYNENFKIAADFDFYLRTIFINKIKFKRVDQNYVLMRYGGESTKSFSNHNKSSFEILNSFKINHIRNYFIIILMRFPLKIIQYFLK